MNKLVRPFTAVGLFLLAAFLLPAVAFGQPLPTPADFVRNLDVRCYRLNDLQALNIGLQLTHLNPALINMGLPPEQVNVGVSQELCVPVFKNTIPPSATSLPFIRFVDWRCYRIDGPPLNVPLTLTHLNPVIPGLLGPGVNVMVREPQQLCLPVRKNNANIPLAVLQLIRWLDVKCYRVEAPPVSGNPAVTLTHLNPLITQAPETVSFLTPITPTQLCVPVRKNQAIPPANVLPIIQFSDVLCYRINGQPLNQTFVLNHLNPLLLGQPPQTVTAGISNKLCVPVAKNGFFPPG